MPRPLITLEQVVKDYRNGDVVTHVLKGIDLTIDAGEYVALMGRSGAGKSTLMNILGCLDRPTRGAYHLDGEDVSQFEDDALSEVRGRAIGFVFQSFHLLNDLDVRENVELPMEYQDAPLDERRARSEELLTRVGLAHRMHHTPLQLSGGERQRVAIARALANHPRIVLADEPTGNLDSGARDKVLRLFEDLIAEENITLIMVTHDELIGERAERCVIVADGVIFDDGR